MGYAEERSKLQKEVAERQRVEQMALWREHLDYSVSKERLYNYQSASSLILDKKPADVTAVSTDASRKSSKQIAPQSRQTNKTLKSINNQALDGSSGWNGKKEHPSTQSISLNWRRRSLDNMRMTLRGRMQRPCSASCPIRMPLILSTCQVDMSRLWRIRNPSPHHPQPPVIK